MLPDASDEHWGSFLTQVPQSELDDGVAVQDMSHEPLGLLSGTFRGSQLRWATIDKEGFAIISTFRRLEYLLWGGVNIHTDHRNFGIRLQPGGLCIFRPKNDSAAAGELESGVGRV